MTTFQNLQECLDQLRRINVDLRRQLELVEAVVPVANDLIRRLGPLDIAGERAVLGEVVFDRNYDPRFERPDSCQLFQAVVTIPGGFGVALWDLEQFLQFRNEAFNSERQILLNFVLYDKCSLAARAMLWPQIVPLLHRVCTIVRPIQG